MKYGLIKDKEDKQEKEVILKNDEAFREALKTRLLELVCDYLSGNDIENLTEGYSVMEELALAEGITKRDFKAMCSIKRKETSYSKRRYNGNVIGNEEASADETVS